MSDNSMKNKRELSKIETYNKIVKSAKIKISSNGILNLTTLEIAKHANVAHGTIFSHFPQKELLYIKVFSDESKRIAKNLYDLTCDSDIRLKQLLINYLNTLIEDEGLHENIAREFPFYKPEIQNEIICTESIVRNLIYEKIEKGIANKLYTEVNITMAISYLFGTINFYLSRKGIFAEGKSSVLEAKKKDIIDTFFNFITTNND